ncbi:unnamed protein product [Rangifer tarandus platyrhynchus]|uniref:Uncharacterized protein n=1 Tax=Rangifer tarandus platyrhynchus TaxID=3082113 RepID=A0ABN8XR29_RANTA|nr:unnamed protein product [Rangifer tarandus platyrhynchus]
MSVSCPRREGQTCGRGETFLSTQAEVTVQDSRAAFRGGSGSSLGDKHDHGSTGEDPAREPPRDSLESRPAPVPTRRTVGLGGWGPGEGACPPVSDLPLDSGDGVSLRPPGVRGPLDRRPQRTFLLCTSLTSLRKQAAAPSRRG